MDRKDFLKRAGLVPLIPYTWRAEASDHPSDSADAPNVAVGDTPARGDGWGEQRLHIDSQTDLRDLQYYLLGNGRISVVVQHAFGEAAQEGATPLALLFWDPHHFVRKWSTCTFHPEWGLKRGMISVEIDGARFEPNGEAMALFYDDQAPQRTLVVQWKAGDHTVEERLWVHASEPILYRRARILRNTPRAVRFHSSLYYNHILFTDFRADAQAQTLRADGLLHMELFSDPPATLSDRYLSAPGPDATFTYLLGLRREDLSTRAPSDEGRLEHLASFSSDNEAFDHLFRMSRDNLRAMIAADGRYDASVWQYNMEWTIDAAHAAIGAAETGQHALSASILTNILTRLVNERGVMAHASRFRDGLDTELNQQGAVLAALWTHWAYSGDATVIREQWETIRRIGNMPLEPPHLHESGLAFATIEFFERDLHNMGVQPGFDLSHQVYLIWGLSRGAVLATVVGDAETASRWEAAAARMQDVMLNHPRLALVSQGRFIKRRLPSGEQQRFLRPPQLSDHVPADSPLARAEQPRLDPDMCLIHPALYGIVTPYDPRAVAAREDVATLWDPSGGGYLRYHPSADPEQPGGWFFPSVQIAKALADAGDAEGVARVLSWLTTVRGAEGATYVEFNAQAPRPVPPLPPMGIIVWVWAEVVGLFTTRILGVQLQAADGAIRIRPMLPAGMDRAQGEVTVRGTLLGVTVTRARAGAEPKMMINGRPAPSDSSGGIVPEHLWQGDRRSISVTVR